jgi:hypothetical protein
MKSVENLGGRGSPHAVGLPGEMHEEIAATGLTWSPFSSTKTYFLKAGIDVATQVTVKRNPKTLNYWCCCVLCPQGYMSSSENT